MKMLARREHSSRELALKLQARFDDPGLVDETLAWVRESGYLDDRRFTEFFVRGRVERGHGPMRIRADLQQKGIDDETAEQCLAEAGADWFEMADRVRRKRFGDALPGDSRSRARQARFLAQRGFTGEHVREALGGDIFED